MMYYNIMKRRHIVKGNNKRVCWLPFAFDDGDFLDSNKLSSPNERAVVCVHPS